MIREPPKTILIKPKEKSLDIDQARDKLMKSYDAQKENVRVRGVRRTRAGIVIEAQSEKDIEKIRQSRTIGKDFETETMSSRNPRVIVYDVQNKLTAEQFCKAVYEKTKELAENAVQFNERFKPRFKTGKKKAEMANWVAEVTPSLRRKLLEGERLFVVWMSCKVHDYLIVTKCSITLSKTAEGRGLLPLLRAGSQN